MECHIQYGKKNTKLMQTKIKKKILKILFLKTTNMDEKSNNNQQSIQKKDDKLKSFIERIERLSEEKNNICKKTNVFEERAPRELEAYLISSYSLRPRLLQHRYASSILLSLCSHLAISAWLSWPMLASGCWLFTTPPQSFARFKNEST